MEISECIEFIDIFTKNYLATKKITNLKGIKNYTKYIMLRNFLEDENSNSANRKIKVLFYLVIELKQTS